MVDKRALLAELRARITAEVAAMTKIAKDAALAATHEENKPENDKDMRSTEASYIARGQAERVRVLERAVAALGSMSVREFAEGDAIQASALVDVAFKGSRTRYLIVPVAGGMMVKADDDEIHTLATTSPLGKALLGLSEGDEAEVDTPQGVKSCVVLRVC
jgi:transcription elongation GreA/GreB family factor